MTDADKLLARAIASVQNVRFQDAVKLAESFGFELSRISGSHHIFKHPVVPELLNLQNVKGEASLSGSTTA